MGTVSLSDGQQRMYQVLVRVHGGKLAPVDAAGLLGLSVRHVRRLVSRMAAEGMEVVVHGNVGRAPKHKTAVGTLETIQEMLEDDNWARLNVCHLQERLAWDQNIRIGRSTLHRLLASKGALPRRKERIQRRSRRPRFAAEGMLIQIDGSSHHWFQERGPRSCLMISIDDATSKIVYAHFQQTEDQAGYLRMIQHIATKYGLPMAYYHDKHTILRSPAKSTIEDELAGREPMSAVQRVLHDLGVESIAAHSPQAKGRVERLYKTLQDRLVNEMAFESISTCDEANRFLETFIPAHNQHFVSVPKDPEAAWVTLEDTDIFYHCSIAEQRSVRHDHTISWQGKTLQIVGSQMLAGTKVDVRTDYNGDVRIYSEKTRLTFQQIDKQIRESSPLPQAKAVEPTIKKKSATGPKKWLYGHTQP